MISASFILSIRIPFCVLCFFLIVINLRFLPLIVMKKLVLCSFGKGKTPLEHSIQLQEAFSFFSTLYVHVFISLHLIWTHNHLVRKQAVNHLAKLANLAKWLGVRLQTKWLWVRVPLQSLKLQISHLFRAKSSLTFTQLLSMDSLWNANITR